MIFKSMSGNRSIVRCLSDADLDRLEHIRSCPVQFQAFVPGTNVRVHTVGGQAFATEVQTDMTDYRYADRSGGESVLRATKLPDDVEACIALAADLGLPFAGVDPS